MKICNSGNFFGNIQVKSLLILGSGAFLLLFCTCSDLLNKLKTEQDKDTNQEFISDCRTIPMYMELPEPQAEYLLATDIKSKAEKIASTVMGGDTQDVVPALMYAVLEGGIGIRNSTTKQMMFENRRKGNSGFCFMDWEINCLARSTTSGVMMTMGDLASAIGFLEIGLDSVKALTMLYDGLQKNISTCQDTNLYFRALFINALTSKSFPHSGIVSSTVIVDGNKPITQLQASLLLMQYATDLMGYMKKHPEAPAKKQVLAKTKAGGCNFDEAASSVMDVSALGITYGMGKLLDYLDGAGMGAAGKYAKVSGAVSAALALIKYMASGAALEVTLDVEDGEPLIRTTSTKPGERKVLRAVAKFNIGNWSYLNCARLALNAANTDFNLPSEGPISNASVSWSLNIGSTNFGADVLDNSIVQFYSLDGNSIAHMKTDQKGMTRIGLEGAKQSHDLEHPLTMEYKTARVEVRVAINSQTLMGDILSGVGAVTSGPYAVITIPLEILSRIPIQGRARNVAVQDWEEYQY